MTQTSPEDPAHPSPSPLSARPGAVRLGSPVALHHGDPLKEQRLLEEGLAVVDLGDRGVVTVTGPDRLTWLHSLVTQDLAGLPPHHSAEAILLTPQGRIEHVLHVVDDGETTWITTDPGHAAPLAAFLDSMRFMLRVEVADRSDDLRVLGEPVAAEGLPGEPPVWRDPWPGPVGETAVRTAPELGRHPGEGWAWREVVLPADEVEAWVGDRPLAGRWALEALRVAAWRPAADEVDERSIPHELDWLRTAVHLRKGCYRGQETVARVQNLGQPPRRLVFLHLDGSGHELPVVGAEVRSGAVAGEPGSGRVVGRLTSVARHHELGPIGLAVVKRSVDPAETLTVDATAAAQEVVVAPGGRPRRRRP
ncbi:folate-binding protein YgfZ [Kytococcus schroeteri]|uniref:Folate-binding protein YgfZ n=1 Tax=Kytococcus schroeteri TaxID=138300 RepID=A0A2I1P886_9MICO|nr:folate-binding protein YgfZ [Kytococcus schroeteri]PKZ40847.1 folate-binding protein YgfZ [Kytococcus schroeteri]